MKKRGGLRQIIRLYSNWCVVTEARITFTQRSDATPEVELDALAAVYRYVLFDARKGGPHDLTNDAIPRMAKNGPQKTEREKT